MRIAIVHSFYVSTSPSGENDVVLSQVDALTRAGHDVVLVARSSDDIPGGVAGSIPLAYRVATGRGASPVSELRDAQPEIVHVHNLFPNWGRAWLREWDGPVVTTQHNFRHSCAAGTFYRDGAPCTECLDHGSVRSLVHRCYRGSVVATAPLSIATAGGAARNALLQRADAVIALSERAAGLHRKSGVAPDKIAVVPNFVADAPVRGGSARSGWVYVGRLADEKGVLELAQAWPAQPELRVFGAGPLESRLRDLPNPAVGLGGLLPPDEVQRAMASAEGIVFSSRWAEGAVPAVYLQALAVGTPVIAWAGSSAADDVAASGSGLVLDDWARLPAAIVRIRSEWGRFSARARERYVQRYTERRWLTSVQSVYEGVL